MQRSPEWAAWLVAQRTRIDRQAAARLGPARPEPGEPAAEALRRFRSFATSALQRGEAAAPALDGLRVEPRRAGAVIETWCGAAGEAAGGRGPELRRLLQPLAERFQSALLGQSAARTAARTRSTTRRAVVSAIDRIAEAFLAVDLETGRIVDANPAAGALLGVPREALLGSEAPGFVHDETQESWKIHLEALVESPEPQRFGAVLRDATGDRIPVQVSATRYRRREGPLALVVARPSPAAPGGRRNA